MASVLDIIKHYQQAIEKYSEDEGKVLRCIDKLFQLKVTVQHLQETGVGRTVNALRKEPGEVGQAARALVLKWKTMVAAEESDQEGDHKNDTSTQNGHGSGRDSDDHMQQSQTSSDQYTSTISTPKSTHTEHKEMNGHHSGSKRKYHSSEDEDHHDTKKKSRHTSSSEDDHKKEIVVKTEKLSESESSDEDSESSESDSDSYSSESSREEVKVKTEIKQEFKKEKVSPERDRQSSKESHSNNTDYKRDSSSSKRHDSHSHHKSSSKDPQRSSEKSFKSSSHKHKNSHEKESSTDKGHKSETSEKSHKSSSDEKRHKSDTSSDEKKESKASKHSSEKPKSSSHKQESTSDRHKSSSDKHSSKERKSSSHADKTQDKHKTTSEKEIAKHKPKESKESSSSSSKDKHSISSKDKPKERSSSSKESSSHNHHSEKKHTDSKSHSSKSKHSSEDVSEKKSKDKSSSSHKSKSSSSSSKSKHDVPKKKSKLSASEDSGEDGIDCGSGASFAEALGMISPTKPKKKIKDVNSPSNSFTNDLSPAALLAPSARLAPLPALEISALPEISPHYRPRPPPKLLPHFTDDDAISAGISTKNQRTKVYSGNKTIGKITSLYEMCVHVLQEHIDALEYTGGVPYDILKPVVDRASPHQLYLLEHYNPYLMEDTDHLWKSFCDKSFRGKKRQELESWREMYMRCQEEQEHKLKSLTANIKLTQEAKKAPVKQTKMAYVDSIVKPPRSVARKQAQHGTAHTASASPAARVASLSATPGVARSGAPRPPPSAPLSTSGFNKPKKAPLMQKALQFMRGRKR